jgi:hypothetical protein
MNDVAPSSWPRVVWWSFYEGDASFDQFLVEAVQHLNNEKLEADDLSGRNAVTKLLGIVRKPGTLLVLDGFERVLRAFGGLSAAYQGDTPTMATDDDSRGTYCGAGEANRDCVSPLAQLFSV